MERSSTGGGFFSKGQKLQETWKKKKKDFMTPKKKKKQSEQISNIVIKSSNFRRVLYAVTAMPFLMHENEIPLPTRQLISDRASLIFTFVLAYLNENDRKDNNNNNIDLYASGGYVRDLLLGRISDDLDLSFGMTSCPKNVTTADVAAGMNAYTKERPDLGITSVEVVSRKSKSATNKAIDATQVSFTIIEENNNNNNNNTATGSSVVCIDLLPTIRSEVYDIGDRIPIRDPRGSAEEDSLRRDLTIGSMMLKVTTRKRRRRKIATTKALSLLSTNDKIWKKKKKNTIKKKITANDLRFVLLDYHDGVDDISTRTLRCPVPRNTSLNDILREIIVTPQDEILAERCFGLTPQQQLLSNNKSPQRIQSLWWSKMIKDDPLRLFRVLRFATTLNGFRPDSSFYSSANFALLTNTTEFQKKVSASRKVKELRKVVGYAHQYLDSSTGTTGTQITTATSSSRGGASRLVAFFNTILKFPVGRFCDDPSLFRCVFFGVYRSSPANTNDDNHLPGSSSSLSTTIAKLGRFNNEKAQKVIIQLPPNLSVDETIGAVLTAVFLSCTNDDIDANNNNNNDSGTDTKTVVSFENDDNGKNNDCLLTTTTFLKHNYYHNTNNDYDYDFTSKTFDLVVRQVREACDGLQVPTSIRRAAIDPLVIGYRLLLEPIPVTSMHELFAQVIDWPSTTTADAEISSINNERAKQFARAMKLWELLKLSNNIKQKKEIGFSILHDPNWVLTLLKTPFSFTKKDEGKEHEGFFWKDIEEELRPLLRNNNKKKKYNLVNGGAIAGLPEVPLQLRSQMINAVHVLLQLQSYYNSAADELEEYNNDIVEPEQLREYLEHNCDGLFTKLTNEWRKESS